MKKFKAAVIGCGKISERHLDAIVALDTVDLVAVCDIKEEKANKAAEKYSVKAYTDYIKLFKTEELDAVHICLPHYLHTVVAQEAFRYGINVLSEKPMSIKLDDAIKTVEMAKQKNLQYVFREWLFPLRRVCHLLLLLLSRQFF